MAKTNEAILKNRRTSDSVATEPPSLSNWTLMDLRDQKQMGDLEKRMDFYKQKNQFRVFHFVGSQGKEGVSTIIANLANYIIEKETEKDTLVIDANFKNPVLHTAFGLPLDPGLYDLLTAHSSQAEAIYAVGATRVKVLPSGKTKRNAVGGLLQEKLPEILNTAKQYYKYILIDSPPLLTSSDALYLSVTSDVTFLVVRAMKTRKEVAEKAKGLLQKNDCEIGGVVINRVVQVIPEWLYKFF